MAPPDRRWHLDMHFRVHLSTVPPLLRDFERSSGFSIRNKVKENATSPRSRTMNSRNASAITILLAATTPVWAQTKSPKLPDGAEKKGVVIYSDGVKMRGDLYLPKGAGKEDRRPAVLFCAGTAGVKAGTPVQMAPHFLEASFVFLAFDYRGWGESDGKLIAVEPIPKADAKGEVTMRARVVRWQMDFADQTQDIRAAISFLAGEPGVDPERIGILGTSYGGGLVTWVASVDPRVRCVVAQVPGMGGRPPALEQRAYDLATRQARGETEPVPLETGKPSGAMARYGQMRYNIARGIGMNPLTAAEKIRVPMLIVVAEKEELLDNKQNGEKVHETLKARNVPTVLHVLKDMGHYGVYKEGFEEATRLEIRWFETHLKKSPTPSPPK
jgi:dipeptidyl aminopeptidase/acylaminoacyl peptidase